MFDLLKEVRASARDVDENFIVGDFNKNVIGTDYDNRDQSWLQQLRPSGLVWKSGAVPCGLASGDVATFYDDIINILEFSVRKLLAPVRYYYDVPFGDAKPSGSMQVLGIAHGMVGVLMMKGLRGDPAPATAFPEAPPAQPHFTTSCRASNETECDANSTMCKGCLDRCTGGWLACRNKVDTCPKGPTVCPPEGPDR
jgi:hypothetical protein